MKVHINIDCCRVETELKKICRDYINEKFDQTVFREKANMLVKNEYDASKYTFAYVLLCGYMNLFSEYEPDDKAFRGNVEKVLSEIENKPYISESWLVSLEETGNANVELLHKYWSGSADGDPKDKERIYRELERIEKSKIQYPDSIRDVIYNSIISLMSMWEPVSKHIGVNHTVGTDACKNQKIDDKLNYLFDVWFGKEKLLFQFNYVAGDVYICVL